MQLPPDTVKIDEWYEYTPCGRCWAVYHYTRYEQPADGVTRRFSIGEKESTFLTKLQAREETYRLNKQLKNKTNGTSIL